MKFRDYITEAQGIHIYNNRKGDTAKVYERGKGFYVEINNKYDMTFKNEREFDKWLKKEKFEWVGTD